MHIMLCLYCQREFIHYLYGTPARRGNRFHNYTAASTFSSQYTELSTKNLYQADVLGVANECFYYVHTS